MFIALNLSTILPSAKHLVGAIREMWQHFESWDFLFLDVLETAKIVDMSN